MSYSGVNLLPDERKQAHRQKKINISLLKISVVVIAVVAAGLLILKDYESTVRETRTLAQTRVTNLKNNLEPFNATRAEALLINDRLDAIESVTKNSLDWDNLIATLAQNTPADIVLGSLSPTLKNKNVLFTTNGEAGSRESVIIFKNALEKSGRFENITYGVFQITSSEGSSRRVSFNLSGSINVSDSREL